MAHVHCTKLIFWHDFEDLQTESQSFHDSIVSIVKNIEKWPESLGVMFEFKYIEHGLLFKIRWKQEWFGKSKI